MSGQAYSFNLGLDIVPISTDADPDGVQNFHRLYNAVKGVAIALDSAAGTISKPKEDWSTTGIGYLRAQNLSRFYCLFSESVISGNMVSIWDNAGTPNARKAGGVGLAGGLAAGFVLAPVTAGQYGEIFLSGANTAISGMTSGVYYDLSNTTAGLVSAGVASPNKQTLGIALTPTCLWFQPTPFTR